MLDDKFIQEVDGISSQLAQIETFDTTKINTLYVDGNNGSDSNDGLTPETPFKTLFAPIGYLRKLGEAIVDGIWEIQLKGTFTQGLNIHTLPRFRSPLKLIGEVDETGTPVTIIDGTNATTFSGLYFQNMLDLKVEVKNIKVQNFKNGSSGVGIKAERGGYIFIENCEVKNCDIGYSFANNVNHKVENSNAIDCSSVGFTSAYSCSGTFGGGSGSDLTRACRAYNCGHGFDITRNSVVHIDYCEVNGATYNGILVDMASRAHVLGSVIRDCNYGVRVEGTGEWINNTTETNTFINCTVNYGHFGSGRETRLYSQTGQVEHRIGVNTTTQVITGNVNNTIAYFGSDLGVIPGNYFGDGKKKLRLRVWGKAEGTGTKNLSFYTLNMDGTELGSFASIVLNSQGSFEYVLEVIPTNMTTQKLLHLVRVNNADLDVVASTRNVDFTKDKQFRAYGQLTTASDTLTFEGMEVYLMG